MEKNCTICDKPIEDKQNWTWADENAHKLCVLNEAETACDEMCCFSMLDEEGEECECGSKQKRLTAREKKALFV